MRAPVAAAVGVPTRPETTHVVAVIGGGGKTTLIEALARELTRADASCVVTTTTHIIAPGGTVVVDEGVAPLVEGLRSVLGPGLRATAAAERIEHRGRAKLRGLPPDSVCTLAAAHVADLILVEADGSAGRPLKAHAGWEPVIPACSDRVLAVFGLTGLGAPLDEAHVHRTDLFAARAGLPRGAPVTAEAIARAFFHHDGPLRSVDEMVPVVAILAGPPGPRGNVLGRAFRAAAPPGRRCDVVGLERTPAGALRPWPSPPRSLPPASLV